MFDPMHGFWCFTEACGCEVMLYLDYLCTGKNTAKEVMSKWLRPFTRSGEDCSQPLGFRSSSSHHPPMNHALFRNGFYIKT